MLPNTFALDPFLADIVTWASGDVWPSQLQEMSPSMRYGSLSRLFHHPTYHFSTDSGRMRESHAYVRWRGSCWVSLPGCGMQRSPPVQRYLCIGLPCFCEALSQDTSTQHVALYDVCEEFHHVGCLWQIFTSGINPWISSMLGFFWWSIEARDIKLQRSCSRCKISPIISPHFWA